MSHALCFNSFNCEIVELFFVILKYMERYAELNSLSQFFYGNSITLKGLCFGIIVDMLLNISI